MSKKFLKYLLLILWAGVIFILSSIPGDKYSPAVFNWAWIAHFVEFSILSILFCQALEIKKDFSKFFKKIILVLIICALYALSDEIHQMFVINRSACLLDWLVDFLGIILGIKFWLWKKIDIRNLDCV